MLDIRQIREQHEFVRQRMATRHMSVEWEKLLLLDQKRRETQTEWESLKEKKNRKSVQDMF